MPPGGHVDQGLEGGDGRQDAEAHKVLKGVGADAPRVAGGGDAVGQAEHVRRDPRGVPGEVDVVVDEAGEHQAAGAVDDLLHVRGVDVAVLRRRDDPAAGDRARPPPRPGSGRGRSHGRPAARSHISLQVPRFSRAHAPLWAPFTGALSGIPGEGPGRAFSRSVFSAAYPNRLTGSMLIWGTKPTMISASTRPTINGMAALEILSMLMPDMEAPTNRL